MYISLGHGNRGNISIIHTLDGGACPPLVMYAFQHIMWIVVTQKVREICLTSANH